MGPQPLQPGRQTDPLHRNLCSAHSDKDIRIHPMEGSNLFPGQQILLDCGLPADTLATLTIPERENPSWSHPMLQAMRVINSADIDEKTRNTLRKEFTRQRGLFQDH